MRQIHRVRRHGGFSMIEALVAAFVGVTAVGAFATFTMSQLQGMRDQSRQVDLQTSARGIVDLFATEARRAGKGTNPNCIGVVSTGIVSASSSEVRIKADVDGDGALTQESDDVTYTLNLNTNPPKITRTVNNTKRIDTLWSGVSITGSSFKYYDQNGNQLTGVGGGSLSALDLLKVIRIKIELTLTAKTGTKTNSQLQTVSDSSVAQLRNRYFITASSCAYH